MVIKLKYIDIKSQEGDVMARDIKDEIRGLDMAYLFGKIPRSKYIKTRNKLKLQYRKK